ncbi:MAG: GAF domain-containing protein, partial [Chloroflexota bacterium]
MGDQRKKKAQLIEELDEMRQLVTQKAQALQEAKDHLQTYQQNVLDLGRSLAYEREQRTEIETRLQINTTLNSTLQYDEVLDLALDQLGHLIAHDAACVILAQGNIARIFRWYGYARFGTDDFISPFILNIPNITSLRTMRRTGRPVVYSTVDEYDDWVRKSGQPWIKSYMAAPICVKDQIIGFLNVDCSKPGFFDEVDAGLLQGFVGQVSSAIRNAWLYRQARHDIIQRVKHLRKERNFFAAVLENSSALDYVLDADKRLVQINPAFEKSLGYQFDELKDK